MTITRRQILKRQYLKAALKLSDKQEKKAVSNTAGRLFLAASWRKYSNVETGSCQLME
jgi:hypothetical protein